MLHGSPRDTQRTFSTGSTDSAISVEQECPQTDGGDSPRIADRPFEVGDMVKVERKESPWYGVVRWIGQLPGRAIISAGIEMVYTDSYIPIAPDSHIKCLSRVVKITGD